MEVLLNAIRNASGSLKGETCLLVNTYLTYRQMGEVEAVYKVLPDLHFKESNIATIFVSNCPRSERIKFLLQVDDQASSLYSAAVKVKVKVGDNDK